MWAKVCQNADPMLIKTHCTHTFPALWGDRGFFGEPELFPYPSKFARAGASRPLIHPFFEENAVKDIKYFSMGLYFGNLLFALLPLPSHLPLRTLFPYFWRSKFCCRSFSSLSRIFWSSSSSLPKHFRF
jgi:hypothetical protein